MMKKMKKFTLRALAALALCLAAASLNAAAGADTEYKTYVNPRFGYSVDYPDIFGQSEGSDESGDSDGIEFESGDGEYTLTIWGGDNATGSDGNALLEGRKNEVAHIVPDSEASGGGFYTISYSDDGGQDGNEHIFHEYGIVNKDARAAFVLRYPKDEEKRFAEMITRMKKSLALPGS
jgi:hypothetical protein